MGGVLEGEYYLKEDCEKNIDIRIKQMVLARSNFRIVGGEHVVADIELDPGAQKIEVVVLQCQSHVERPPEPSQSTIHYA